MDHVYIQTDIFPSSTAGAASVLTGISVGNGVFVGSTSGRVVSSVGGGGMLSSAYAMST